MNGTRNGLDWGARLLIGLVLILVGASAAVWGLAHNRSAARLVGIETPVAQAAPSAPRPLVVAPPAPVAPAQPAQAEIAELRQRLERVENAAHQAQGSAGRADALLIAFAARRAIDRGVALGYLETLLRERFGGGHPQAVATIISASHQPVRLQDLSAEYQALGPELKRGGAEDSWWTNVRRELGQLVEIHPGDRPAVNFEARYRRAQQRLGTGDVDQALAETMRMPGAGRASGWIAKARRYIAAHRSLDEIESAALLPTPDQNG